MANLTEIQSKIDDFNNNALPTVETIDDAVQLGHIIDEIVHDIHAFASVFRHEATVAQQNKISALVNSVTSENSGESAEGDT